MQLALKPELKKFTEFIVKSRKDETDQRLDKEAARVKNMEAAATKR
jgi:hypothetical protein